MQRILLTGMFGTGNSSVIEKLRKRGFVAVDMDEPGWTYFDVDGNQLWHEKRLQNAIDTAGYTLLFVSGCAENQVRFYPQFTDIILLSAPAEVISERLRTRTNNSYGKQPKELEEVLTYLETVEPLLRRGSSHELKTTIPLDQVVEEILAHVDLTSS